MTWNLCRADEIRAQIDRLAHRACDCCCHADGICRSCHRMHSPATADGCEVCAPEDEDAAVYVDGQGRLEL